MVDKFDRYNKIGDYFGISTRTAINDNFKSKVVNYVQYFQKVKRPEILISKNLWRYIIQSVQ